MDLAASRSGEGGGSALSALAEQVRSRVDIVEVVSEYVALRPAGRSYKGLCPFHAEKTPSFTVSPDRQLFYCFGCGTGGNVFTFLMKLEGLTFTEALERLGQRAGLGAEVDRALSGGGRGRLARTARLWEVQQAAARWFARRLWEAPDGEAARRYLERRGVDPELARRFQVGYAPDEWHALEQALGALGFGPELLVQAGLVVVREGAGRYDRFRGRLMFAVADAEGRIVGFGGRALGSGQEPKYLNSPETPVYQKGRLLYGLDRAKEAIRRLGRAIVVEGYMDVLAMHQFGLTEAVATCGTSLTPDHGRLLARFASQVVVAFDADAAGQAAALRGLEQLRAAGLDVRVAVLPEPHDPDSLLRQEGRPAMEAVLERAQGIYEYAVERALAGADLSSPAGKARAAANVLPILAEVPGVVEQEALVTLVARRLEVPERAVRRELWRYRSRRPAGLGDGPWARHGGLGGRPHGTGPSPYTHRGMPGLSPGDRGLGAAEASGSAVERALVRLLLELPELIGRVSGRVSAADFSDPHLAALYEGLVRSGSGVLDDPELSAVAGRLLAETAVGGRPDQVEGYVRRLREVRLERELSQLESKIQAAVEAGGPREARLEVLAGLVVSYREVRERLRREGVV